MSKLGPIKRERAIFNAIRMNRPSYGRELHLAAASDTLTTTFYNGVESPEQAGKTLLRSQGNH